MSQRLRLTPFCELINEERETVRSLINRNDAPIPRDLPGMGSQRTYSGDDLFRWFGFQELRSAGVKVHLAAKLMRHSGAVETFLEMRAAGEDVRHFCLFFAREYPMAGGEGFYQMHETFLRDGDVASFLKERAAAGRYVLHMVMVPILPIFVRCLAVCAENDLSLSGTDLAEDEE